MKFLLSLSILICASFLALAAPPETQRKQLQQPTVIQGYPCDKGYAFFFLDSHLNRCVMSRDIDFGEARIPKGSLIELRPDGGLSRVMLKRDAVISGVRCSGGGLFGPGEGPDTVLYPSGRLKMCYLPSEQLVQGVPCARATFWTALVGYDQPVEFYEDGRLKSCRLSQDFRDYKRGDRFVQQP